MAAASVPANEINWISGGVAMTEVPGIRLTGSGGIAHDVTIVNINKSLTISAEKILLVLCKIKVPTVTLKASQIYYIENNIIAGTLSVQATDISASFPDVQTLVATVRRQCGIHIPSVHSGVPEEKDL